MLFRSVTLMARKAAQKASALTPGEQAQPPSGFAKGKKQQQQQPAVANTMSVDVVVNDQSTGGGPNAPRPTGIYYYSLAF